MYQRSVLLNLPKSESLDIEFNKISYSVSTGFRKPKKEILKGVDGCFKSGELTAIMGPSGAGKSSLLNILTGFHKHGVSGTMTFKSKHGNRCWNDYKKESCYILQDDILHPLFTVSEVMMIAAELKLGSNLNLKAKQMVIDDVLEILDLSKTKETRCDRLSGGQRKRLSIALELIDNPPVMFLDEPTTGLDYSASVQCMAMLQNLAKDARTIVCTIHQPSATIYEMFNHVYLLAEGRCVYQGDGKNTIDYLRNVGLNCPKYHNPADYIIEVVSKEHGDFNERLIVAATDKSWRATKTPAKSNLLAYNSDDFLKYNEQGKTTVLIQPPSEFSKFLVLVNRNCIELFRDWTVTHLKLVLHVLVGILLGLLYADAGENGHKTISNVCFLLVNVIYICYTSLMPAVLKFPSELPVVRKESFNNWYKLRTYYAACLITNIPVQLVFTTFYSATAYFMSSQPADINRFLMFLLAAIMVALIAESLGLALGTICDPINGTFLGAIITCAFLVFAGFLVFFKHMPRFMYYITYTSYLRYAFEAMVHSVYGYNRANLHCPAKGDEISYCPYRIPSVVMNELAMADTSYWLNIGVLFAQFILLRIFAYATLKRKISRI